MLFTKCILSEPAPADGVRISVMSRHTLSDGTTPDSRIEPRLFSFHWPSLGPSAKLVGDYYKRGLSWVDFVERYLGEVRTGAKARLVHILVRHALERDVTLLCIEETAERCHRRLLAEECQRIDPRIVIEHR